MHWLGGAESQSTVALRQILLQREGFFKGRSAPLATSDGLQPYSDLATMIRKIFGIQNDTNALASSCFLIHFVVYKPDKLL